MDFSFWEHRAGQQKTSTVDRDEIHEGGGQDEIEENVWFPYYLVYFGAVGARIWKI